MASPFAVLQPPDGAADPSLPVVVLLGWVGTDRDGPLLKYAELLAAHGYCSCRSVQPVGTAFSLLERPRRQWAQSLLAFLEEQRLWPQRRLVLYAFSNGGAFVVEQLLLLAERDPRYAQLPGSVAGFIFDSAPAFVHPGIVARVQASFEPPGLRRSLMAAYWLANDRVAHALGRPAAFWANMQRLSWGRPLLYFYSADDPLADGAKIDALVAEKRRRGHDVTALCWDKSGHVAHLRHHRHEYEAALLGLLARASSGGGGSGSGSGTAAGGQPPALRSRL